MSHVFFDGTQLRKDIATLFEAAGLNKAGAADVADALVEADEEGVFSHGTMLVPMYVERLQKGSLSKGSKGKVVQDSKPYQNAPIKMRHLIRAGDKTHRDASVRRRRPPPPLRARLCAPPHRGDAEPESR